MRILVIHQYYLRPDDPGGSRFNEMCRYWAEAGHDVTVLAGQVHYQTGEKPAEYEGEPWVEEFDGPVRVIRAWGPAHRRRSTWKRMASIGAFGLSASIALRAVGPVDFVVATSPTLLVIPPAIVAKTMHRCPLLFEVRDLWPESAVTTGVLPGDSILTDALYELEALGYEAADVVNALTPGIKSDIVARGHAASEDVVVIPNGVDVTSIPAAVDVGSIRDRYGWGDRFVVLYAGAHGVANHLWQYVDAAELLDDRDDVLLVAIGEGAEREALKRETKNRGLDNMQWLDPVPKHDMWAHIAAADAGAAILQNNPTFRTVYPNKIFDYMAMGKPVLCGVDGDARRLVVDNGAGLFFEPENADDFADAILELRASAERRDEMGRHGRALVEEQFDRRKLASRYLDVIVRSR